MVYQLYLNKALSWGKVYIIICLESSTFLEQAKETIYIYSMN